MFITITGCNHYRGYNSITVGQVVCLQKEPHNTYDSEAIAVYSSCALNQSNRKAVKLGYVANSVITVINGTSSAGRIYDGIDICCKAKIKFKLNNYIVAELI